MRTKSVVQFENITKKVGNKTIMTFEIESLWGIDYEGDERTVDVHIKRLRERIEPFSSLTITTVRGLGYRLEDK